MCLAKPLRQDDIPKPYRWALFCPLMTFLDLIVNVLFPLMLPLAKMAPCTPDASPESLSVVHDIRKKLKPFGVASIAGQWEKLAKCPIGEYVCTIPVKKDILQKWNILNNETEGSNKIDLSKLRDNVKLLVRFPTSLLPSEATTGGTDDGFVKVDNLDLSTFALDATVLVQFHGGGFVIGGAEDMDCLIPPFKLLEQQSKQTDSGDEGVKPLVSISVDYALAPEHPFPAGVIEAMSVIDYLLESNSRLNIHVSGTSAGCGICIPAALEASKRYPGRIASVHAHAPFLDPKGDSMSYYMLTKISRIVPCSWLRWCWRAYLGMEPPPNKEFTSDDPITLDETLRRGSNATAWEQNQWNTVPFNRLARPIEGLSLADQGTKEGFPLFLITVNKADPLYSEGVEFARALEKSGLSVSLFEHGGCHVIGSSFDPKGEAATSDARLDALFGPK